MRAVTAGCFAGVFWSGVMVINVLFRGFLEKVFSFQLGRRVVLIREETGVCRQRREFL